MHPSVRSPVADLADRRLDPLSARPALDLVVHVPDTHMDPVLREAVSPLIRDAGDGLDLVYFHRHVKPVWNLRIHVAGEGGEFTRGVEDRAGRLLAPLRDRGLVHSWRRTDPEPAMDDLASADVESGVERLFHHDTAACLAWLDCAAAGATTRSRREFSLLMTERVLDLLAFGREARLAFYHLGCCRPFEQGTWGEQDRSTLDERYAQLRDSLRALVAAGNDEQAWGGPEPAAIANRCLAASRPHLEGVVCHAPDPVPLAHALCQRHGNRLGIDGLAEAVLRYFMLRLHEEAGGSARS